MMGVYCLKNRELKDYTIIVGIKAFRLFLKNYWSGYNIYHGIVISITCNASIVAKMRINKLKV